MPTVLRVRGFRIGFFSADWDEPPHVHVTKAGCTAKFWLEPVQLAGNFGFTRHDLGEIDGIVREHQRNLLSRWHDYFEQYLG
jgi:hypothetical protein